MGIHTEQDVILPAAGATALWQLPPEGLLERALFHGTCEPITGPIRVGGYDGVFWTARQPAIAQTYIPASTGRRLLEKPDGHRLADAVPPEGTHALLIAQMGFTPNVTHDAHGRVTRWGYGTNDMVRYADILRYIEQELGYQAVNRGYDIKSGYVDGVETLHHADYKTPGQLFTVLPQEPLRLFNMARGGEPSLQEPDYHRVREFRALAESGYDGVLMHDWAQSPSYGNVGHLSYGLFPGGLAKSVAVGSPATHFDFAARWQTDRTYDTVTPDFFAAHRAAVADALAQGLPVPAAVRAPYAGAPESLRAPDAQHGSGQRSAR
jgi:hypothetical protein